MKEQIVGNLAICWRVEGIVGVRQMASRADQDDLEVAIMGVEGLAEFTKETEQKAFLVTMPSLYQRKEVLDIYQQSDFNEVGVALVVKSFAGKIGGNMFLKLANRPNVVGRIVPTKLFTNEEKAIVWLQEQIKKAKNT
ncbi:MAG: hypothetical protein AB8E82_18955 [Aureispira sp.]